MNSRIRDFKPHIVMTSQCVNNLTAISLLKQESEDESQNFGFVFLIF